MGGWGGVRCQLWRWASARAAGVHMLLAWGTSAEPAEFPSGAEPAHKAASHRLTGGGGALSVAVPAMPRLVGGGGRLTTGEGGSCRRGDGGGGRGGGGMGGKGAGYTRSAVRRLSRVTVSLLASQRRSSLPPERSQKRHGAR